MLEMKFKVFDRTTKRTHTVGANEHDAFYIWGDNQVTYYNYQTGEASLRPDSDLTRDDGSGYILMLYSGKHDMKGEEVYEGDVLESQVGGQLIVIRYGVYKAYCPADKSVMDGVGFYATSEGYPDMPIGNIEEYAVKVGNVYEDSEWKPTDRKTRDNEMEGQMSIWDYEVEMDATTIDKTEKGGRRDVK